MNSRRVIVNADDFGMAAGVSRGIIEAHQRGVVTSTSAMSNMAGFERAAPLLGAVPTLSVGVHVTLTCGRPCASDVDTLIDAEGNFLSLAQMCRRLMAGRIAQGHLEREMSQQFQRCFDVGITPNHVDSHQHIHFHPVVFRTLRDVAGRFGVKLIRWGTFVRPTGASADIRLLLKWGLLSLLARQQCDVHSRASRLLDFTTLPRPVSLERLVRGLPAGVTEIVCHPGIPDAELREVDPWHDVRQDDLAILTDSSLAAVLVSEGIALTS